jgi:lysophospholipase L1-like esterase
MAVIYCFGDSITYGAWDIEKGGWANRLRAHFDDLQLRNPDLYYLVYNLGIPGERTDGFIKRFESELAARQKGGRGPAGPGEATFIFAFGANDYVFIPDKNDFVTSKEEFMQRMQTAIDIAKKHSSNIVLLNITPANEAICAKNYGNRKLRLNKNVELYNGYITELARSNGCKLVGVYSAFASSGEVMLSEDGIHPNEKGHQLIFERVKEAIGEIK